MSGAKKGKDDAIRYPLDAAPPNRNTMSAVLERRVKSREMHRHLEHRGDPRGA